jgi:hypothetical protein
MPIARDPAPACSPSLAHLLVEGCWMEPGEDEARVFAFARALLAGRALGELKYLWFAHGPALQRAHGVRRIYFAVEYAKDPNPHAGAGWRLRCPRHPVAASERR